MPGRRDHRVRRLSGDIVIDPASAPPYLVFRASTRIGNHYDLDTVTVSLTYLRLR